MDQEDYALNILKETAILRIQLIPTISDYFELALMYLNICSAEENDKITE